MERQDSEGIRLNEGNGQGMQEWAWLDEQKLNGDVTWWRLANGQTIKECNREGGTGSKL